VIGGEEIQAQWLAKSLNERGIPVHVLARRHSESVPKDGLPPNDCIQGVDVTRVYSRGGGKLGSLVFVACALWHLVIHGRKGIYSAHDVGATGWLAVIARFLLRGRSVVKLRSGVPGYVHRYSTMLGRWQFSILLRSADRVVQVNKELERFTRELGLSPQRVAFVPNAVDTKVFSPSTIFGKTEARRRLALPLDKTVVLYVGRLEPVKGVDILLSAWSLMSTAVRSNSVLVVVGDGLEREHLMAMADFLGIRQDVIFAGAQQMVREYYKTADIFVLPSRSEGMSVALAEAMSCGLPVVASAVGGAKDILQDGQNGVIFAPEDNEELARKLSCIIENRDRWDELGLAARETAISHNDLEVLAHRMCDLYAELG